MARAPHTQRRSWETERQVGGAGFGSEDPAYTCTPSHCLSNDAKRSVSLFTSVKSNLRDRVWGEVEKESFLALPGKGGHSELSPQTKCPNLGKIVTRFIVTVQRSHDQLVDILLMGWW